ncbi:MAG: hypothetical protein JW810_08225 [Sedimentisphaerales bacterium]|nr:hypothetical protein [Sedimentisphaerales bacterium]
MFQRRLLWITALVLLGIGVLVGRLVWLQILQGRRYLEISQTELILPGRLTDTVRGEILDCRGRLLAVDRATFDVCLHYKLTRLYDQRYLDWCRRQAGDDAEQIRQRQRQLDTQRARADELLRELADLCAVPVRQIQERIEQINQDIFVLRTMRARRRWYQSQNRPYVPLPGAEAILADFARLVPGETDRLERVFQPECDVREMLQPQRVLAQVSQDVALTVEERMVGSWLSLGPSQRLISIETGKQRVYPYGQAACHLIGQVRPVAADQVSTDPPDQDPDDEALSQYRLGDRQGEWGVEYLFETRLAGRRGWIRLDRDHQTLCQIPARMGREVRLTIDIELEQRIRAVFESENPHRQSYSGAAVLVDIPTGQIRALVSVPGFDLNSYYQPENFFLINEINGRADPAHRKRNRALSVNYMPGSTIKPTMLWGALEQGIIDASSQYECLPGKVVIMPSSVCYLYGHGWTGPRDAIKKSCNHFFIELASKWGPAAVQDWLEQTGFGRRCLAWPQDITDGSAWRALRETAGHIAPIGRQTPTARQFEYMSVGLGALDGSVLQIANSMATIARDGVAIAPSLIAEPETPTAGRPVVPLSSHLRLVQAGMQAVIYEYGGTAHGAFHPPSWPQDQVLLHGKTGTTEFSVFAGYALDIQRAGGLALAVLVEDPGGGSSVAAPLARQIWLACGLLGYLPKPADAGG